PVFVRKKKNPSGVISVQVIDKSSGKYRIVKTIGSSSEPEEIKQLYLKGKKWMSERINGQDMFGQKIAEDEEEQVAKYLLSNVENVLINGTEKLLNRVYKRVGFDKVDDGILRYLTIARLSQP